MSYVAEQIYLANNQVLEARLQQMEQRLNEQFNKEEEQFAAQTTQVNATAEIIPAIAEQINRTVHDTAGLQTTIETRVNAVLTENREILMQRSNQLEEAHRQTQAAMTVVTQNVAQVKADVNAVATQGGGQGSGGGRGGKRQLIDAKNFTLKVFDGDRDSKQAFEEWREDIQDYLNSFFPGIKGVLDRAARWKDEIDQHNIHALVQDAGIDPQSLAWTYADANQEIYTFIKKYVTNRARKAFETSSNGGFDAFRVMVTEIDPINHRTKAAMMEAITGMVRRGASKTAKELKARLLDLGTMAKKYLQRTGEEPDVNLLASVLANLLDDKTRETFVNDNIMHDFKAMRIRILQTATEADTSSFHMHIGNVSEGIGRCEIGTPVETPAVSPAKAAKPETNEEAVNAAEASKRPPNPNIRCFTCNKVGHPSFSAQRTKAQAKEEAVGTEINPKEHPRVDTERKARATRRVDTPKVDGAKEAMGKVSPLSMMSGLGMEKKAYLYAVYSEMRTWRT